MMIIVRSKNPENYKKILKKAIDNGYRMVLFSQTLLVLRRYRAMCWVRRS